MTLLQTTVDPNAAPTTPGWWQAATWTCHLGSSRWNIKLWFRSLNIRSRSATVLYCKPQGDPIPAPTTSGWWQAASWNYHN